MTYYRAMSLEALNRNTEAARTLNQMRTFATDQMQSEARVDSFDISNSGCSQV